MFWSRRARLATVGHHAGSNTGTASGGRVSAIGSGLGSHEERGAGGDRHGSVPVLAFAFGPGPSKGVGAADFHERDEVGFGNRPVSNLY
jgi:hypothetical protein